MSKPYLFLILCVCFPSACSLAPEYHPPPVEAPPKYKEVGDWLLAKPHLAELGKGPWWEMYQDPELNALEAQIIPANQSLKAALARYDDARAAVQVARADYFPTVVAGFNPGVIRASSTVANPYTHPTYTDISLGFNFVYIIDIWGRVRNSVAAAGSLACASASDLAALNLSLQTQLASDYFSLRGDDAAQKILDETVVSYQKALVLVRNLYQGGAAAYADVAQAENQLQTAKTLAADLRLNRAQLEHAIALLIGRPPSEVSIPVELPKAKIVTVNPGLPSMLLERRPDIAEGEQKVQAANAEIGVARAAYFPNLTLTGGLGVESQTFAKLFKAASLIWAIGPPGSATIISSGTTPLVTQTLIDGGRISGLTGEAWAQYFQTVANYRQTVLNAFKEVEDSLVAVRQLDEERMTAHAARVAADQSLGQANHQFFGGLTTYLNVVIVLNIDLQSKLNEVNVNTRRQLASVQLIEALGGSFWQ